MLIEPNEDRKTIDSPLLRFAKFALPILFFCLLAVACFVKVQNFDIFWRIVSGDEILRQGRTEFPNIFNSTTNSEVYPNESWLFDLLASALAGMEPDNLSAIVTTRSAVFVLIFLLLFLFLRKTGTSTAHSILILLLSFAIISFRIYFRNFLFSYFFAAIFTGILYFDAGREKPNRHILWILPLLMVVWTNYHALCVLGLLILAAATAAEAFKRITTKGYKSPRLKILTATLILTLAAAFISPHPGNFIERFYYAMVLYPKLIVSQEEQRPLFAYHKIFYFSMIFGAAFLPYAFSKKKYFSALIFIGFALAGLRGARFIGIYGICSIFYFANITSWLTTLEQSRNLVRKTIPIAAFALVMLVFTHQIRTGPQWGVGINCDRLPCDAAKFIRKQNLPGPLYNNLGWGGYLLWRLYPDYRVFWDGRFDAQKHLFLGLPRENFNKYLFDTGFRFAVLPKPEVNRLNAGMLGIEKQIIDDPIRWVPIFFGRNAVVLLASRSDQVEYLDKFGYWVLRPWEPDLGFESAKNLYGEPETYELMDQDISRVPDKGFANWLHGRWTKLNSDFENLSKHSAE